MFNALDGSFRGASIDLRIICQLQVLAEIRDFTLFKHISLHHLSFVQVNEDVLYWMNRFNKHKCTAVEAAASLGICRATFFRWISSGLKSAPRKGTPTFFTPEVEEDLCDMLISAADYCMGFTKVQFRKWVKQAVDKVTNGKSTFKASESWIDGFLRRNPRVESRVAANILPERIDAFSMDATVSFFAKIEAWVDKYPPERMFNADETGLEIKPRKKNVSDLFR